MVPKHDKTEHKILEISISNQKRVIETDRCEKRQKKNKKIKKQQTVCLDWLSKTTQLTGTKALLLVNLVSC